MAKRSEELNWVNVNADALTGDLRKAWDAMHKARDAFRNAVIAQAKRSKAIGENETLIVTYKAWGFGMAKVAAKAEAKDAGKDLFASL